MLEDLLAMQKYNLASYSLQLYMLINRARADGVSAYVRRKLANFMKEDESKKLC
jgi:hypothetical protein